MELTTASNMSMEYTVRVTCMTYNQADFIVNTMDGFCMQDTQFPFVCVIVDDASTDGEQEVIQNYLEQNFDLNNQSLVRNEETEDYVLTFAQHILICRRPGLKGPQVAFTCGSLLIWREDTGQGGFGAPKAMAAHSSALAWKIPGTEEPGGLQSMGSRRVGHDGATSLSLLTFMHWRRKWQPTPVFLPGESQGRGSLVGCRLWGCAE